MHIPWFNLLISNPKQLLIIRYTVFIKTSRVFEFHTFHCHLILLLLFMLENK